MSKESLLIIKKLMNVIGQDIELDQTIQAATGISEFEMELTFTEVVEELNKFNRPENS